MVQRACLDVISKYEAEGEQGALTMETGAEIFQIEPEANGGQLVNL